MEFNIYFIIGAAIVGLTLILVCNRICSAIEKCSKDKHKTYRLMNNKVKKCNAILHQYDNKMSNMDILDKNTKEKLLKWIMSIFM